MKIKIMKNGPFHVIGKVPLIELTIEAGPKGNVYRKTKEYEVEDEYYLCRCGKSMKMPYCDGNHAIYKFDGTLTASRKPVASQAMKTYGKNFTLEDNESLCAYARFCHSADGDVWNLVASANPENEEKALKMVHDCPSGRLVMIDNESGEPIEPAFEPSIAVIQDPMKDCGGPLWVRGGIPIEDENGEVLEIRNRVTLCRCGFSKNKPYCDASHINNFKKK